MAESGFVDYVKIYCRSGKGGQGSVHFYRSKRSPKGGPDGGDGGRGGDVYLRGDRNYWTLLHLRYNRHIFAGNGKSGGENNRTGTDGDDIYIDVPLGTACYDADTGDYITEVREHGEVIRILKGGRGGQGNTRFATSTNQAPRFAQPGEAREERVVILQLKLLADVGLVGFPNAGKSTLLSAITTSKPKVANYPFTTLVPNLGIVKYRDGRSFVMADIPGIIEGAAEGKGLGLRFLRHIERNAALLFLIPSNADNIAKEYEVLLGELEKYNPSLLEKNRVLGISKSDLIDEDLEEMIRETLPEGVPVCFFSSVTGQGVAELKDLIWKSITVNNFEAVSPLVEQNLNRTLQGVELVESEDDAEESSDTDEESAETDAGGRMHDEDPY
ncbi:GTPase ObgE [uncultured Porphyromonas sp.]|uniref:GTPase ObgE n=1 Tax=uncultured Porphyromonas sp. TaxID=159274 RepID=UPI00260C2103|nr:GTPase ObgE [uncultured Porphyromonas sp.]